MAEESREINKCAGFQADSEMVGVVFNMLMGMKSGVEAVKAFTTALSDEYRGAYERRSEQRKPAVFALRVWSRTDKKEPVHR